MNEDLLDTHRLILDLPKRGEVTFLLVASVPGDTDWDDVLGMLYELGGDFTGDFEELDSSEYERLTLLPTEEGLFMVAKHQGSYELYLQPDTAR